jgi:hypothetical protein
MKQAAQLVGCVILIAMAVRPGLSGENDGVIGLRDRLCALDPADPRGYFRLGEEVAYEMPGPEGRGLAERLFVLALERDMAEGGRHGLAAGACIALADLTPRESERAWLIALSKTFDLGSSAETEVLSSGAGSGERRVAEAIALFRGGAYRAARERLRREDGANVYAELEEELADHGMSAEELESKASCPECRNRRVVRPGSGRVGERGWVVCGTCRGNPGAGLDGSEFMGLLVLETELLDVEVEQWSAQYVVHDAEPVRDVDPSELALWYGIDPRATAYRCPEGDEWRDGEWLRP